jgi:hypothetical protein
MCGKLRIVREMRITSCGRLALTHARLTWRTVDTKSEHLSEESPLRKAVGAAP